jgi:hypothetical protein
LESSSKALSLENVVETMMVNPDVEGYAEESCLWGPEIGVAGSIMLTSKHRKSDSVKDQIYSPRNPIQNDATISYNLFIQLYIYIPSVNF